MCQVCQTPPGKSCWPNGNDHPGRGEAMVPGPRVQVFDRAGENMLYDSATSDVSSDDFLAACAGQQVMVRVKSKIGLGAEWSGLNEMEKEMVDE